MKEGWRDKKLIRAFRHILSSKKGRVGTACQGRRIEVRLLNVAFLTGRTPKFKEKIVDPFKNIEFILENHCALDGDELNWLDELLEDRYCGNPLSVQNLHTITVWYHEANGIKKFKERMGAK